MNKKITVLNGSPRNNGNTSRLVEAFVKGARSSGNDVDVFRLSTMDIRPCVGCCRGERENEIPCTQRDGMASIYPSLKAADVFVFASPLYWWHVSGQLKCAIDRIFALSESGGGMPKSGRSYVRGKTAALLMAGDSDGFDEAVVWYEGLCRRLRWIDAGRVLVSGVVAAGDIEGRPELEKAEALGASI